MPLKYGMGIPEPTQIVGMFHGILFIGSCLWVILAAVEYNWSLKTTFYAFVASVLPFGTMVADKKIFKLQEVRT
jgi:integral membrane protein